jgi:hypothetical protein
LLATIPDGKLPSSQEIEGEEGVFTLSLKKMTIVETN